MNLSKDFITSRYQKFCQLYKYEHRNLHNFISFLLPIEVSAKDLKRYCDEWRIVEIVIEQLQTFSEIKDFKNHFYPLILSSGNRVAKDSYLFKLKELIVSELKDKFFVDLFDCIVIYSDSRLSFDEQTRQRLDKMIYDKINEVDDGQVHIHRDDLTYVKLKNLHEQLIPKQSIFWSVIETKLITLTNYKLKAINNINVLIAVVKAIPDTLDYDFPLLSEKITELYSAEVNNEKKSVKDLCDLYYETHKYLSPDQMTLLLGKLGHRVNKFVDLEVLYGRFLTYSKNECIAEIIKSKSLSAVKCQNFKNFTVHRLRPLYKYFSAEAKQLLVEKFTLANSKKLDALVDFYDLVSEFRLQIRQKVFEQFLYDHISARDFNTMNVLANLFVQMVNQADELFINYAQKFCDKWLGLCINPEQVLGVKNFAKHLICLKNQKEFADSCQQKSLKLVEQVNDLDQLKNLYKLLEKERDEVVLKDLVLGKIMLFPSS